MDSKIKGGLGETGSKVFATQPQGSGFRSSTSTEKNPGMAM